MRIKDVTIGGWYAAFVLLCFCTVSVVWAQRTGDTTAEENPIKGNAAVIAGGIDNRASGERSVVGGGRQNKADGIGSVVSGGFTNSAEGGYSTVSGGWKNQAPGYVATVGGGWENRSTGLVSTVSGGQYNEAAAAASSVGGGWKNIAAGAGAVVPGGRHNRALGNYSFAAGRKAVANHDGSFVWSDDRDADFASTGNNQFLIQAEGNVGIDVNAPTEKLTVGGVVAPGEDQAFSLGSSALRWTMVYVSEGLFYKDNLTFTSDKTVTLVLDADGNLRIPGTLDVSAITIQGVALHEAMSQQDGPEPSGPAQEAIAEFPVVPDQLLDAIANGSITLEKLDLPSLDARYRRTDDKKPSRRKTSNARGTETESEVSKDGWVARVDGVPVIEVQLRESPNVIMGHTNNAVGEGSLGATVSGGGRDGSGNIARGSFSVVSGGVGNEANGPYTAIGGGFGNNVNDSGTTVAGGIGNVASNWNVTVSGGRENLAAGLGASIGGGRGNVASNRYTVIPGGYFNTASGSGATVGGGFANVARGFISTIPGGSQNEAAGEYSLAAGRRAGALHNGTFVWADARDEPFVSTSSNQVLFRAENGVGIGTAITPEALNVAGNVVPAEGSEHSLGTVERPWKDAHLSGQLVADVVEAGTFVGDGSGLTGLTVSVQAPILISNEHVTADAGIAPTKIAGTALTLGDKFGGDVIGPFNSLEIGTGSVASAEIRDGSVTMDDLDLEALDGRYARKGRLSGVSQVPVVDLTTLEGVVYGPVTNLAIQSDVIGTEEVKDGSLELRDMKVEDLDRRYATKTELANVQTSTSRVETVSTAPAAMPEAFARALSISGDGRVGIGTRNPTEALTVAGTVKATRFVGDASGLTNWSGSVPVPKLAEGSVDGTTIADGSVRLADINLEEFDARYPQTSGPEQPINGQYGTLFGPLAEEPFHVQVGGRRALRLEPVVASPNLIMGNQNNKAERGVAGGVISGGGSQSGPNKVAAAFGTVGGGEGNLVDGKFAVVSGGRANQAVGDRSTVGGGRLNEAVGTASVVAGGFTNRASGNYAFIGSGWANHAGGYVSTISGGWGNQATGMVSTISGGQDNRASGSAAAVAGGWKNKASGFSAAVPGGKENVAAGDYSVAMGYRARANHTGSFVWNGRSDQELASTSDGQFLIGATGNVGINTTNPTELLTVGGNVKADGTVFAESFVGDGSQLTGLTAGNLADASVTSDKLAEQAVGLRHLSLEVKQAIKEVSTSIETQSAAKPVGGVLSGSTGDAEFVDGSVERRHLADDVIKALEDQAKREPALNTQENIVFAKTVTADSFVGRGSGLTGVPAAAVEGLNVTDELVATNAAIQPTKIAGTALVRSDSFEGDIQGSYHQLEIATGVVGLDQLAPDVRNEWLKTAAAAIADLDELSVAGPVRATSFDGNGSGLTDIPLTSLRLHPGELDGTVIAAGSITAEQLAEGVLAFDVEKDLNVRDELVATNAAIQPTKIAGTALVRSDWFGGDIQGSYNQLEIATGVVGLDQLAPDVRNELSKTAAAVIANLDELSVAGPVRATSFDGNGSGLTDIPLMSLRLHPGELDGTVIAAGSITAEQLAEGVLAFDVEKDLNVRDELVATNAAIQPTKIAGTALVRSDWFGGDIQGSYNQLEIATGVVGLDQLAPDVRNELSKTAAAVIADLDELSVAGPVQAAIFSGDGFGLTNIPVTSLSFYPGELDGTVIAAGSITAEQLAEGVLEFDVEKNLNVKDELVAKDAAIQPTKIAGTALVRSDWFGGDIQGSYNQLEIVTGAVGLNQLAPDVRNEWSKTAVAAITGLDELSVAGPVRATSFSGDGLGLTNISLMSLRLHPGELDGAVIAAGSITAEQLAEGVLEFDVEKNLNVKDELVAKDAAIQPTKIAGTALVRSDSFGGDIQGSYNQLEIVTGAVGLDQLAPDVRNEWLKTAAAAVTDLDELSVAGPVRAASFGGNGSGLTDIPLRSLRLRPGELDGNVIAAGSITAEHLANGVLTSATYDETPWFVGGNHADDDRPQVLGTRNDAPLHIYVNGLPLLRLASRRGSSGNLLGGHVENRISPNVSGAVVAGGGDEGAPNVVGHNFASVSGGMDNEAGGEFATVGGGLGNRAIGFDSTISGGQDNLARGSGSTISGGFTNLASGSFAAIAGGAGNQVAGNVAAVGGGFGNQAIGSHATVPGGSLNEARGDYSMASGRRAKANHAGSFVWADATDADLESRRPNQFVVRAAGGFFLFSDEAQRAGVKLDAGAGSWSMLSDESAKKDFRDVDVQDVLKSLTKLPIRAWRYVADEEGSLHLGPTAQDFHEAFALGSDRSHITGVDAHGVALAAIQGLHDSLLEKDRRLALLEVENRDLKDQVRQIQQKLEQWAFRHLPEE